MVTMVTSFTCHLWDRSQKPVPAGELKAWVNREWNSARCCATLALLQWPELFQVADGHSHVRTILWKPSSLKLARARSSLCFSPKSYGKAIVLAASCVQTAHIMLNSRSNLLAYRYRKLKRSTCPQLVRPPPWQSRIWLFASAYWSAGTRTTSPTLFGS